jgi:uncharacterized membrane protein YraQ (UPF0718 family)
MTFAALIISGKVFLNLIVPLCLVFMLMLFLNLFVKPATISKFLGREAGFKGILLSAAAGIVSTGPIYAWYPMLKAFREKGTDESFIAVFLCNRAVKPFLLPIMIAYFGWIYVLILNVFIVFGSIGVGYSVGILVKERHHMSIRAG